jgi:hypothetical protein
MDLDINKFMCPAMKFLSNDYPERFNRRVPKVIRMLRTVQADGLVRMLPEYRDLIAYYEELYPAWTNSYGAVAAVLDDGRKLGVKPDEFEVVEFWDCDPVNPS